MQNNFLTKTINKVFKGAKVVNSFKNENHIEFILIEEKDKHQLIWLPLSKGFCVSFPLPMPKDKFIQEFSVTDLQSRLTYLINNFIDTSFKDLDQKTSFHLQQSINSSRNGVYNKTHN